MHNRAFFMLLLAILALPPGVFAQEATEAPTTAMDPNETAHFRVAHFSPDTPAFDIHFDGEPSGLGELEYTRVSNWLAVPAGEHAISLVTAGDGEADPVAGPLSLQLNPGSWTTFAAVGSAEGGTLQVVQFQTVTDDLLPGTTRVSYFNGIEGLGGVGFFRDDNLYTTLPFGQSFSIEHDSQAYSYHIATSTDSPQVLAELPDLNLLEGYNYLIAAVGTPGGTGDAAPQLVVVETNPVEFNLGHGDLEEPGTLVELIDAHNLTGELETALQQAGLEELLSGEGPYTFFAPLELRLSNLPDEPEALAAFLEGHLVEGLYQSQDLASGAQMQSVNGQPINATVQSDAIYVNGARVLDVNLPARNGVMHLINGYLVAEAEG